MLSSQIKSVCLTQTWSLTLLLNNYCSITVTFCSCDRQPGTELTGQLLSIFFPQKKKKKAIGKQLIPIMISVSFLYKICKCLLNLQVRTYVHFTVSKQKVFMDKMTPVPFKKNIFYS